MHGPPLAHASCNPPVTRRPTTSRSGRRTRTATPAELGRAPFRYAVVTGDPEHARRTRPTWRSSSSSRTCATAGTLADYTGELQPRATMRITDRAQRPGGGRARHARGLDAAGHAPCAVTSDANIGAACNVTTTPRRDHARPGERGRARVWAAGPGRGAGRRARRRRRHGAQPGLRAPGHLHPVGARRSSQSARRSPAMSCLKVAMRPPIRPGRWRATSLRTSTRWRSARLPQQLQCAADELHVLLRSISYSEGPAPSGAFEPERMEGAAHGHVILYPNEAPVSQPKASASRSRLEFTPLSRPSNRKFTRRQETVTAHLDHLLNRPSRVRISSGRSATLRP